MRKALLLLVLGIPAVVWGAWADFREMVVRDAPGERVSSPGVRITYLGVNGYLIEGEEGTILVDPYFTRTPLASVALNLRQRPSEEDLAYAAGRLPRRIDAILVTHGHFDHLLDVPSIAQRTGAEIVASPTSVFLVRAAGAKRLKAVLPEDLYRVNGVKVRVLQASHDCILGRVPFPGNRHEVPPAPRRPSDWVCGEPLAFLIEMGGQRIYVDSGGTRRVLPPGNLGRVDLAIMGVALADSRARLPAALERLRPRAFLPSHQDNFFQPVQRGFSFGWLTDFPEVIRRTRGQKMVLLDYFSPWTVR